ncbi:MAG: sugar phosphate nucleotidyltransferase, partial [Dehalococcoidia bacterium]|nr:sugar phosphate nucleotidyltransferase [Dehalococcoidia bacterium]
MKAVILAAGEGTRMRPLTYTRPKVMLPIANKPILEHLLNEMKQAGISDFVFVVGYHDEQVRDYFGDGKRWDVNVQYVAQRKQLGTADAVKTVESLLSGSFLLVNGDVIVSHSDILALIYKGENTLGVIEVKDPSGLGVVEAKEGRVVRIYEKMEKPPTNLANAGVYMFTPDIFDATAKTAKSPRGEY